MCANSHHGMWTRLADALVILGEFGSTRDKAASKDCIVQLGSLPIQSIGELRDPVISWRKPVDLEDFPTQEVSIRPFCFVAVYYGDMIATHAMRCIESLVVRRRKRRADVRFCIWPQGYVHLDLGCAVLRLLLTA